MLWTAKPDYKATQTLYPSVICIDRRIKYIQNMVSSRNNKMRHEALPDFLISIRKFGFIHNKIGKVSVQAVAAVARIIA